MFSMLLLDFSQNYEKFRFLKKDNYSYRDIDIPGSDFISNWFYLLDIGQGFTGIK
jgi:hypothetical protein